MPARLDGSTSVSRSRVQRGDMPVTIALFVLAVALIYAGDTFGSSSLQALGTGILALGMIAIGVESLRTRAFDMPVGSSLRSTSRFAFSGPAAMAWGAMCLTLGLGALTICGVVLFGLEASAEQLVIDRPGLVIAPVGFIFLCTALGWLLGEETMNASVLTFFVTLPQRIGALVTLTFALAVLGIGVFELLAPQEFDRILESLKPPPFPPVPRG